MIIKKEYFPEFFQFSLNIQNEYVDPHIRNAEMQDILPKIGKAMYDALSPMEAIPTSWVSSTNYAIGSIVLFNGAIYKATATTTNNQPDVSSQWNLSELFTFFWGYIRPFGVFACFREFLIHHGINITQFGLRVSDEATSFAADGNTRASMLDNARRRMSQYESAMNNKLCEVNWTFDNIKYEIDTTVYKKSTKNKFKISSL